MAEQPWLTGNQSNPQAPPPGTFQKQPGKSCHQSFKDMDLNTILRVLRVLNILMSILCGIAAVVCLMLLPGFTKAFMCVYCLLFSAVLLFFELRFMGAEKFIRDNFGFLFSYWGRCGYLTFLGTLCFSLDVGVAYVIGAVMILNAIFNAYLICLHPEFHHAGMSGHSDPTTGYTTAEQEAARYAASNPDLAARIAGSAVTAAANNPQMAAKVGQAAVRT